MVWGLSPEQPGTGLGALTYAMRAVAGVARPVGGSGAMTEALRAAVEHRRGEVRTSSVVTAVLCERDRVRGVRLADGTEITAPVVVSACDPRRTFVEWLEPAPSQAADTIERWRQAPHHEGYGSKVDAVVDAVPRLRDVDHDLGATVTITPSLDEMDRAAAMLPTGGILERPALMANVPSVIDPSVAPNGHHVFSLEVLLTPYRHPGGWPGSAEPRRWLELFAARCEPGFLESILDWRAVTPDVYERDFHLPGGHAASFGGGPLATLRHPDPELTRYDTAVPGLYLTGAATFPGAGIWGASGRNCATVVLARAS
jgi:phytoene dehydrogenase-like protein